MLKKTTGLIRIFLGITFLFYGLVKVAGGQFKYDGFVLDSQTTDGPSLVWCFYGYSPLYGRLIGLAEIIPALLLFLPRTRTLGALLLLPIAANITVMDFCFHFPDVKYFALLLTALDLCLLMADRRKLALLLRLALANDQRLGTVDAALRTRGTEVPAVGNGRRSARSRRSSLVQQGLLVIFGVILSLFLSNLLVAALTNPVEAATDYCVSRGWDREDLSVLRWNLTSGWSGFGRKGVVEFEVKDAFLPRRIQLAVEQPYAFADWQIHEDEQASEPAP
jgi:hypothetical protein